MRNRTLRTQAAATGAWSTVLVLLWTSAACESTLIDQEELDAWKWATYREGLKDGREEGLKEGREEGLKEGQEQGREEGRKAAKDEFFSDAGVQQQLKEAKENVLKELALEVESDLLTQCWDRRAQQATPSRLGALKDTIHQSCLKAGGCDAERVVRTDGCWAEVELLVHGAGSPMTCGLYDRPLAPSCGELVVGPCEPGWQWIDCQEKGASPSTAPKQRNKTVKAFVAAMKKVR